MFSKCFFLLLVTGLVVMFCLIVVSLLFENGVA